MTKEEIIGRIVNELPQLTDAELKKVYDMVRALRTTLPDTSSEKGIQPKDFPFVDEIERVQSQSRDLPGHHQEGQHFA